MRALMGHLTGPAQSCVTCHKSRSGLPDATPDRGALPDLTPIWFPAAVTSHTGTCPRHVPFASLFSDSGNDTNGQSGDSCILLASPAHASQNRRTVDTPDTGRKTHLLPVLSHLYDCRYRVSALVADNGHKRSAVVKNSGRPSGDPGRAPRDEQ